jgi:hypothetical protein
LAKQNKLEETLKRAAEAKIKADQEKLRAQEEKVREMNLEPNSCHRTVAVYCDVSPSGHMQRGAVLGDHPTHLFHLYGCGRSEAAGTKGEGVRCW